MPQISSKSVGMYADGIVYGETDIWRDHSGLRSRYDAVLLNSDDYATFTAPGTFWVTVVPSQATSSPDRVNRWCRQRGFTPDTCYAKVLGQSAYSVTTKRWSY
ncbi:hypothetical protein [Pseudonocardia sp. ICBG1034]|uniref:hypothetical protein n=1 Tax=Pseudonocardia sp. ICBG1034 TaxID=2844381 RepID=UPI001CCEDF93|nr:hypothetical protein [Pseudonocardia sp. ICBG1034]